MDGEYNGCAVITHGLQWDANISDSDSDYHPPQPISTHKQKEVDTDNDNSSVSTDDDSYKFYYLCKFCVRKAAQGLGLGDLLWRSLQRDIERLYWRSRTNNPLNAW